MPSNFLVFDRIRAFAKQHKIYQAERVYQDQPSLDRLVSGGDFLDFNVQSAILDQTNLQINRLERYKDYEQMDQTGEVSLALDLYADEGCLTGDTRVPLLDGACPTIAELANRKDDFWVYSFSQKENRYVPALARNARVTGENVPVIKVILDDGSEIKATSNHLFMLNNGSFVEAGSLKSGDLLKSCIRSQPATETTKLFDETTNSVVRVEPYGVVDKVYDLEVPDTHCFAAGTESSWVIVHNSLVDPERKHTLVIRARNRRLKKELEELLFSTLLWDNYCRPALRYLCKYGDLPFEIIPSEDRDHVTALRFMNVYNFTRIETRYGDLVGFFYQDAMYPEPQFMHPWQVMHLRLTSFENIYHPYGRCLDGETLVSTPIGPVKIRDITPNQKVYSWDGAKAVETTVVKQIHSGTKTLLEIKTKHHTLRCTHEHPILVDGYGYKLAKDIKNGDRLVIPEISASNSLMRLELPEPTNANCVVPNIPEYADELFVELFGFLVGDGWATDSSVEFATSDYTHINSRYVSILQSYGLHCTERKNELGEVVAIVCNNVMLAGLMRGLGLIGKAHEKNVPQWIFSCPQHLKEAFLAGYANADGCLRSDSGVAMTSCNKKLLQSTRYLATSVGYKCGTISGPFTNNSPLCDSDRELERYSLVYYRTNRRSNCLTNIVSLREAVAVNTSYAGTLRSLGYKPHGSMYTTLKRRCDEYGIDTSHFKGVAWNKGGRSTVVLESPKIAEADMAYITEQVVAIEPVDGLHDVYDIQVEDHHNFIADGVVVHNSILDGGRKAFKQLRLMEDAALIYRITRAPEKRKFTVPVGLIPPKEIPEYMQMIARNFKRQRFYNPTTGSFDERYSPLIQEDDFFLPRRPDGSGPDITTLPGAENLDQIADIEYFKKKMIAPTKIPFARVGIGEGAGESSEKSLSQSHSEFAKAVQWIQREVSTGLTKVAIVHLALRGFSVEDLRGFDISLSATSAMEELYRIETWQTRASVMAELKDLGWFPKEWIVTRFTDLSPDEIEELKDMETTESQGGSGGGMPGGLDVPGDEDLMGDMGDAEEEDNANPGLDLGKPEDNLATPIEGYDYNAERRLLNEMRKDEKRKKILETTRKWANRLGKDLANDDNVASNNFNHLIETKELDGLTISRGEINSESGGAKFFDPNHDTGLLVEWSVPKDLRDEAIKEVYEVLTIGEASEGGLSESDEITDDDLPVKG